MHSRVRMLSNPRRRLVTSLDVPGAPPDRSTSHHPDSENFAFLSNRLGRVGGSTERTNRCLSRSDDDSIKQALRTLRERAAAVDGFIGPMVDTPMPITEDRLAEVKKALNGYEQAKNAYHDALRNAGRTPPHQVA